jgi:hypothetical protein
MCMTGEQENAQSGGGIEVVNRYQWVANPRQGRLRVSIDGKSAGFAPLEGSLRATVAPGNHTVRISLWRWYWSRRVDVDVQAGSTVVLEGDIDRSATVLKRMADMLIHPLSCMVLKVQATRPSDERMPDERQAAATAQAQRQHTRQITLGALVEIVGFLLLIVGAHTAWPIALLGVVVVVAGSVWMLRSMQSRKRELS